MPVRQPASSPAPAEPESFGPSRLMIGVVAILCWVLAAVTYFLLNSETPSLLPGAAARVGLLFAALWLAIPPNGRLGGRTLLPVGIVLLLAIFLRGRMLFYVVPLLAVAAFVAMVIRPKSRHRS